MLDTYILRILDICVLVFGWISASFLWTFVGMRTTSLVSPVDPNFRSAMLIGGACVGVLVMILTRKVTLTEDVLDGAMSGDIKYQLATLFIVATPIAVGGFSGYESAALFVECHAFYGTQPNVLQKVFFVEKHTVNRKGPDWLYLRQTSIPNLIPISCGYKIVVPSR